ncbi:ankyrin, partial [Colletotrichum somersetense]
PSCPFSHSNTFAHPEGRLHRITGVHFPDNCSATCHFDSLIKAMASSSSGKRPFDAEWRRHKLSIERMFFAENKSILEIQGYLEDNGLTVSKSQLETRLKLWNFRKKVPKSQGPAVWQFVDHRLQKRQQQGKQTDVVIYGMVVDPTKVRKQIMHHPRTTIAKFNQPSPRTPEGMEISLDTPAPLPMQFSWPDDLPWHRFEENFLHFFSAPGLIGETNNAIQHLVCREEDLALTKLLRSLISRYTTKTSVTQLAADIGSIVPENYENENMRRASRLLQGSADEKYTEYVRITLYKLSNNLSTFFDDYGESCYDQWAEITKLLETSGIMKNPLQLQWMTDHTTNAITEKLSQWAIMFLGKGTALENNVEGRIIIWLLTSGQNPNKRVQTHGFIRTPLQEAAGRRSSELILLLLDHGACPDLSYRTAYDFMRPGDDTYLGFVPRDAHPILQGVNFYPEFGDDRFRLLQRLLETSSDIPMAPIITKMAHRAQKFPQFIPELMELLVHHGADIFHEAKAPPYTDCFINTLNLIDCMANFRCKPPDLHPFFRLLENAGIQNRSQIPKGVNTRSIVLLAAARGNVDFLEDLHSYGINTIAAGSRGISALHVAAYHGHIETCERLVRKHHAPVDTYIPNNNIPSSLHLASARGHLDVVRFLVQNNADINGDFDDQQGRWIELFCSGSVFEKTLYGTSSLRSSVETAFWMDHRDVLRYLVENGARTPAWYASDPSINKHLLRAGIDHLRSVTRISQGSFRDALEAKHMARMEQLLLSDSKPWSEGGLSILEAAIISRDGRIVDKVFSRNPRAYDPGALCAKVAFPSTPKDSLTVNRLLSNRPRSEETLPLEALAIGLAAWSGQMEILELLLGVFHRPALAEAPDRGKEEYHEWWDTGILPSFSESLITNKNVPFWHTPGQEVSPTVFAVSSRKSLSLLLEHGYMPDRITMRSAIARNDFEILELLVQFPRLTVDASLQGPLSYAVYCRNYEALQLLLQNGEDVDEDNYFVEEDYLWTRRNPLQLAVENRDLYLIDLLLKSGADVNAPAAKYGGVTTSQIAAIKGHMGVLRTLVDHGADIDASGAEFDGRTALEGAAEHGRIDVIKYLLSIGVRTTDECRLQYLRAIRYAQTEAHEVAAKLLRDHREWTTDDHTLWARLEAFGQCDLQKFQEEVQQVSSSSTRQRDDAAFEDSDQEESYQEDSGQKESKDKNTPDHTGSTAEACGPTEGMEPPDTRELEYFMAHFKTFPEYRGEEL